MIRLSHVETFLLMNSLGSEDNCNNLNVYTICLEEQVEMLSERLPAANIVAFDMKSVFSMLNDTVEIKLSPGGSD